MGTRFVLDWYRIGTTMVPDGRQMGARSASDKSLSPLLAHPDTKKAGDIFHCCVHRDLRVQHIPRSFLHRAARLGVVLFVFLVIRARRGRQVSLIFSTSSVSFASYHSLMTCFSSSDMVRASFPSPFFAPGQVMRTFPVVIMFRASCKHADGPGTWHW